MPVNNPKEVFVRLLSDVRRSRRNAPHSSIRRSANMFSNQMVTHLTSNQMVTHLTHEQVT
jgi:hypothetical protein